MQNITELRDSLIENYNQMKSGEMTINVGKELTNTAGKIINTLKVELEYNEYLELKSGIKFLDK
jgi:hypothetical protein